MFLLYHFPYYSSRDFSFCHMSRKKTRVSKSHGHNYAKLRNSIDRGITPCPLFGYAQTLYTAFR